MKRKSISIFVISGVVLIAVGLYFGWSYYRIERWAQKLESNVVTPRTDASTVSEVGYVLGSRTTRDYFKREKKLIWWVKIPTTNETWACDWVQGFAGFNKNDSVILVHKTGRPDEADWNGYIVGLHYPTKEKVAQVWAIDTDDIELLEPHEER